MLLLLNCLKLLLLLMVNGLKLLLLLVVLGELQGMYLLLLLLVSIKLLYSFIAPLSRKAATHCVD